MRALKLAGNQLLAIVLVAPCFDSRKPETKNQVDRL